VVAGTTGGEVTLIDRESGSTTSLPWCGAGESCPAGGELLDWIFRLRFSEDGERIAASGNGGEVALWNLEGDREPLSLLGHNGFVHGLAFTADDSVLVSVGMGDGAVRHWSTETGAQLGVEQPTGASLGDAATGPDGTIIVATGNGSLAIVGLAPDIDLGTEGGRMMWPGPSTWETNVCEVAGRNLTADEWSTYLGDSPRRATCPEYPLP
jgi:WD40 repeat protein